MADEPVAPDDRAGLPLTGGAGAGPSGAGPAETDTGLACLVLLARLHGVAAEPAQLAHEFATGEPFGVSEILLAAKQLGLKVKEARSAISRIDKLPLPAIAIREDSEDRPGFFVLARAEGGQVLIQDPAAARPETLSLTELQARWTGRVLLFASRASARAELSRFDFTWFIPAIVKYRVLLTEVLLVSFVLQLFGLVTPLFFQVVMDKVLVHRGFATLDVIGVGFLAVILFDVALTTLRGYVFAHTASRIDVELGARLFRHLLKLPLAYFQARRVGDSVARVRELENIRAFLTGNAITLVLDLLFSVVFIGVMLLYSGRLTLIVLASLPCYVLLSVILTPLLRARLNDKFNRGAENQAFLVETISGIDTVKTMAVEPHWTRKWDNQLAAYVSSSFKTTVISTLANSGVTLISRLVTLGILYLGARLVIDGQLSVGQLIAFRAC